ncbi:hypothetical protein T439DRAFT_326035 [Meredithblackwellia eburnea MCA 4105]
MSSPDSFPSNYLDPIPRHGLPLQLFEYLTPLRAPSPLNVKITIPRESVKEKYSHFVWNAGIMLADRVACGEIDVRGKRVLELGAGVGLPGVVAVKRGARKVVLSDFEDDKMKQDLQHSVAEALEEDTAEVQSRASLCMHTWGTDTSKLKRAGPYDLILMADVIWESSSHAALLKTLHSLLSSSPQATVHFACGYHTGRQVVRSFFENTKQQGFEVLTGEGEQGNGLWETSVEGDRRRWMWESGRLEEWEQTESQEERNRWVLEGVIKLDA